MVTAVIGAGGGVGKEVVKALAAHGASPRALVRKISKYANGVFDSVDLVEADATNEDSLAVALAGATVVVFAASGSTYFSPAEVDYKGVIKTLNAAKKAGVKQVILISSRFVNPSNRWMNG